MTVKDQSQSGVFTNILKRIGILRQAQERDLVGKTVLGRYRVTELVGHGGMGEVYRATQLSTLQEVALKVIRQDLAADPDSIRRFFREARSAGSVNHPNVVRVFDFGQLEDLRLFLAMEFLDGQSLADILRAERKKGGFQGLDYQTILEVGSQVASALNAAHNKGVVHRDLKPANIIIVSESGLVKVVDFGISKILGAEAAAITRTDLFVGTPAYASPEQAMGLAEIDGRSDLYSLGIVLYEMACGRTPFSGIENPVAQLAARVNQDAPPLREKVSPDRIPDEFCSLVDRLLARKREDRLQSAAELVQELAALALKAGLQAKTPSRGFLPAILTPPVLARPRTPIPQQSAQEALEPTLPAKRTPAPAPGAQVQPAAKRSLLWAGLVVLGIVFAVGSGLFYVFTREKPQHPEALGPSVAQPAPQPAPQGLQSQSELVPKDMPPPSPQPPLSPKPQACRLSLTTRPEGAAIFFGDTPVEGKKTPASLEFPCDSIPDSVRLVLSGYQPEVVRLRDLGFPAIQAADVTRVLKKVQQPARKHAGCKSDADCPRGMYCSGGRCKDLL